MQKLKQTIKKMLNLKLITNPEKLRKLSKPVDLDSGLSVFKKMAKVMDDFEGRAIALCACQFGIFKRVIITTKKYWGMTMFNPEIIKVDSKKTLGAEGCLSIPYTMQNRIMVPRYKKITVQYMDVQGKVRNKKFYGLMARAMQHEIDHMDGKLIIDYK